MTRAPLWFALAWLACAPALAQGARVDVEADSTALSQVILDISRQSGLAALVHPEADQQVSVSLRDIPADEAIFVLAKMAECEVEELPGPVLLIHAPAKITLAGRDLDARQVLREIAAEAEANLLILPGVRGVLPAVDLQEVHWLRALHACAQQVQAEVVDMGGGLLLVCPKAQVEGLGGGGQPTEPFQGGDPVDLDVSDTPLADACEAIGVGVGKNVLVDPAIDARVSAAFRQIPWRDAVNALARVTESEAEVRAGEIVILTQPPRNTIEAKGADLPALLQLLARYAGKNLAVAQGVEGRVTLKLHGLHWLRAVYAVARVQGCEVTEAGEDLLSVQAGEALEQRPQDEIARLVDAIEASARAGDAEAVLRNAQALEELVRRREAGQPEPGLPLDPNQLEARIEVVFREILQLAEERQVEELVAKFAELRELMQSYGERGDDAVRSKLERWRMRLEELGEVRLSIQLQVYLNEGNRLLREMDGALQRGDAQTVRERYLALRALVEEMRREERQVFGKNATGLLQRGEALMKRARAQDRLADVPLRVSAIVTVPLDSDDRPAALVNDHPLEPGEQVLTPGGDPIPGLRLEEVQADAVTFSYEGQRIQRRLGD